MSYRQWRRGWVAAALAGLSLAGCGQEESATEPQLRPVRSMVIGGADAQRIRTFSGISKPAQESRLSFKVAGTIVDLPIQVGDALKAGDLVARLDASPYELQAQQAQASLVQAQASERNAAANYERVKGLYENSNASRNDLDAARATSESASAQVAAAQKALELSRLNVEYTRLTAGSDCSVAAVNVELNENANVGTPIAVVNCGEGLEVDVSVPEGLIARIRQGMEVGVQFSALDDAAYAGRVTEVGVSSTDNAVTFPVTLRVIDPGPDLRSGLAAEVSFAFEVSSTRQLIPLSAVIQDPNGSFVFLLNPEADGKAVISRRPVTVGELTEDGLEIISGLESGDRVVTAGVSVIRDGQRVLYTERGNG
ncbi:MAG: efflux RND transporter periplasmic adaptor subunit [Xanthomonadales bacterium]|nr:efflux RND transporter periplasmic adaptor subunit [Xanthomonadales bacterium]